MAFEIEQPTSSTETETVLELDKSNENNSTLNTENDSDEKATENQVESVLPSADDPDKSAGPEEVGDEKTTETEDVLSALTDDAEVKVPVAVTDPYQNDYASFISHFKVLEQYAENYLKANTDVSLDATELAINFIRTSKESYTSGTWEEFAGVEETNFKAYVAEQDLANGTDVMNLKSTKAFVLPNGEKTDFVHMFGVMNITYHMGKKSSSTTTLNKSSIPVTMATNSNESIIPSSIKSSPS